MIKPIPQFEVWKDCRHLRYLIFFESFEDDNSNKAVRDYVDKVFEVKTLSNQSSFLISEDFEIGISSQMYEIRLGIHRHLAKHKGNEQSFIENYFLVRIQQIANKFNKTMYLRCHINTTHKFIAQHYKITPET